MEFLDFLRTMTGPEFLVLYFVWFVLVFGAVLLLRRWGFDNPVTTVVGLVVFAGLGIARYAIGSEAGMKSWDGLITMTILGSVVFVTRWGDSNGGGLSSDGGGCGSGAGCGGGGCGGCGGS